MRILTAACFAAATLATAPALAADYFPWADYAWRPSYSWRDYYAYNYPYYRPAAVVPGGRYWARAHRRYSW